ncbi:hypothetical protein A0U89_14675 (plasmid) [Kozakia baliensis]|uniref:Uncharacterized protein n=1 Tax=Kozakia baliensis TaxID=153496 RepID=A0A1D8UY57_9PROT|nr:hypothetical protein A0U89_14675 [Kozakia baliensis]
MWGSMVLRFCAGYNGLNSTFGNGFVTTSGVVSRIGRDAADFLFLRELGQERRQDRSVTDPVSRHFNSADFQRPFVNPDMKLAPDTIFRTTMFTPVLFTFSLDLDPRAVDRKMKRSSRTAIWNIDCEGFLPAAERAEIRKDHASPARRKRLSTKPVVCRRVKPNRTFRVRQIWIAAAL